MMELWNRISYMVQLNAACLMFMLPAQKSQRFYLRFLLGALATIGAAFWINGSLGEDGIAKLSYGYWLGYIMVCVAFVWICLDISFKEAIYCAICACAMQHVAYDMVIIYQVAGGGSSLVQIAIYILIYAIFYQTFARKLPKRGSFPVRKSSLAPMVTLVVLVWMLSTLEISGKPGFEAGIGNQIIFRVLDAVCCLYVLWVQIYEKEKLELQRELDGINNMWKQQKRQYEVTEEMIDNINRKCHDLKHQIRALRQMTDEEQKQEYFNEIENDIMLYDTALRTGNKALDVVLMDKGLFCKNHDIQWTCMADGEKLDFMKLEDIYAIFGNALDNAIAAVGKLQDREKRVISTKMITQNNIMVIQVRNYYNAELDFEGGLPLTTQNESQGHGFGMKSIRYTAEKYNGTISVRAEDDIFTLQILIPIPEK
ncbi:Uncharacterised protein [uncultured Clostridium sp.]|nr:Uncharacterised protein [uncultured Clostridium sp.]